MQAHLTHAETTEHTIKFRFWQSSPSMARNWIHKLKHCKYNVGFLLENWILLIYQWGT